MKNRMKHANHLLLRYLMVAAIAVCAFAGVKTEKASAAYVSPYCRISSVTQTAATKNSISVSWTAQNAKTTSIYVEDSSVDYKDRTYVKVADVPGTTTAYTIPNLKSGVKYGVKVEAAGVNGDSSYSTKYDAVTLIDTMRNVHQERWWHIIENVDIKWDALTGADGYELVFKDPKGKTMETKNSYSASYSNTNVKNNNIYTFSVRAYQTYNGQTLYTPWTTINCFDQPFPKSIKKSKDSLTISWNKVNGATGYEVYVSSKPKTGYKKVKKLGKGKTSVTIKKVGKTKISKKKVWYVYLVTRKGSDASGKLYYFSSKDGGKSFKYLT